MTNLRNINKRLFWFASSLINGWMHENEKKSREVVPIDMYNIIFRFYFISGSIHQLISIQKQLPTEKVSQESDVELGLYFDEKEAYQIAQQAIDEMGITTISAERIVAKARGQHQRLATAFYTIKYDISPYFPNEQEATAFTREITKCRSIQYNERSLDDFVDRAMENGFLLWSSEETKDVLNHIVMNIFAAKYDSPDGVYGIQHNNADTTPNTLQQAYIEHETKRYELERTIAWLRQAIFIRQTELDQIKEDMLCVQKSKQVMIENVDKSMKVIRECLLKYQQLTDHTFVT